MRRRRVEWNGGDPVCGIADLLEDAAGDDPRNGEAIAALLQADDVEPDDAFFVLTNLDAVVIVRVECMGLGVSVNDRMRMVEVGFVQMLLRNN